MLRPGIPVWPERVGWYRDGKEYITIYYGADVKEKHAQKAADIFAEICPDAEVNLLNGGQPVYYYLISAE